MGAVVGQRGWPLAPVDQRITPPGRPPRRLASVWRSGSIQRDAQSGSCARMRRRRLMDSAPPHPRCAARPQSDVRVACEQGQAPDAKRVRIPDSRSQALLDREAARQCRRSRGADDRRRPGAMGSHRRRRVSGRSAIRIKSFFRRFEKNRHHPARLADQARGEQRRLQRFWRYDGHERFGPVARDACDCRTATGSSFHDFVEALGRHCHFNRFYCLLLASEHEAD